MASSNGPNLGLTYGWTPRSGTTPGESGWGEAMTANLKKLDAVVGVSVLSRTTLTPAVTTDGTRYIVPGTGTLTGDFVGQANKLAVRVAGAWVFYTPARGWLAEVASDGSFVKFDGTNWVDVLGEVAQPSLKVSNPGDWTLPNGTTFTQIQLFTIGEDTASGWSASTYKYTAPKSGVYMLQAMLRPVRTGTDAMPANTTLMLGFGSTAADSVDVVADTSADLNWITLSLSKPVRLVAGTQYFIFGKHSAAVPIQFYYAELKLTRISA